MSKKSSSKTNFLAQGTILVIASFVAKAIGMIYRIPLTHILGDDGNGYYSTANEIYTIILMISSFSLPLAVSRLVAEPGVCRRSEKFLQGSDLFLAFCGRDRRYSFHSDFPAWRCDHQVCDGGGACELCASCPLHRQSFFLH